MHLATKSAIGDSTGQKLNILSIPITSLHSNCSTFIMGGVHAHIRVATDIHVSTNCPRALPLTKIHVSTNCPRALPLTKIHVSTNCPRALPLTKIHVSTNCPRALPLTKIHVSTNCPRALPLTKVQQYSTLKMEVQLNYVMRKISISIWRLCDMNKVLTAFGLFPFHAAT